MPLVGLECDETKVPSVTCSWRTASQLQYILTLECDLDDEGSNTYISRRLDVHRGQRVSILGYRYKDSEIITHIPCLRPASAQKGGFLKEAAAEGIALLFPDTSPRGAGCEDETTDWDFGVGEYH